MTRVLVSAASKHGATREIAETIAEVLRDRGFTADVSDPSSQPDVGAYDAFVLGSAVYAGHWLKPAKELVEHHEDELAARPVWLFSSGPIGDPPKPDEDPVDVTDLIERCHAEGHHVFAGNLDRSTLGFGERAIVSALRAPEGDFRDWDAIRAWAGDIAVSLQTERVS
ncbi:MAG: flavodoxin domain-containing protein [Acidimicrobiia bacterium]|jgi:menaquinone-dependent protoporphyrinogen oxidase